MLGKGSFACQPINPSPLSARPKPVSPQLPIPNNWSPSSKTASPAPSFPTRFERRARRGAACCAPTSTQAVQKASSNFSFKRKAGTMLTQRARHLLRVWFFLYFFYFLYVLYICFFGLDSGGTNPDTR